MAILKPDVYTNADGLNLRFGPAQAKESLVGSPEQAGVYKTYEFEIVASRLPTFGNTVILDELFSAAIPVGSFIKGAQLTVIEPFASAGSATLTLGLIREDGATFIDEDGIDAAIALTAIDGEGEAVDCDGALVKGPALDYNGYVSASVGTANFTAGKAVVAVTYFKSA